MSRSAEVVRTYLELTDPAQLRPAMFRDANTRVVRRDAIATEHYRRLYRAVGYKWYWRDRDAWTDEQLAAHLALPSVFVWECLDGADTAGFFEIVRHDDTSAEIAYFGLVEACMGRGMGKAMLTAAVHEAWALGPSRVWLHTCTLDSAPALPNYLARGFQRTRTETFTAVLPDD